MSLPIYQPGQAEAYCIERGWIFTRAGDELVLKSCPYCGRDKKFYLNNQKGCFSCKAGSCNRIGNFYQLQKEFGGGSLVKPVSQQAREPKRRTYTADDLLQFEINLETDEDAKAYLAQRGLTMETAKAWRLGVKTERDGVKWLLIPYIEGNRVVDIKYRTLPPAEKAFKRWGGGETVLYGAHLLLTEQTDRTLYLVEGEIDAITLWQHGFSPVLSTTAGAGTFKTAWYDTIKAYQPTKIVICYDSDVAGQKGAETLLKKFEDHACVNILLPVKDANEYFLTATADDFRKLVDEAKPVEIDDIYSLATVLDRLEEQMFLSSEAFDGIPSQFPDVNAMIAGGYWNSQLITVSGPSGTGKTSLVLQELLKMSEGTLGLPAYLLCLEMPVEMMMRKIIEHKYGVPMLKQTQEDIALYRSSIEQSRLFLGQRGGDDLESVVKKIRDGVRRYDLKIVAFDNINYFVRSTDRVTQEIARVMKTMKELAKELGIPIVMIAQPRKFDDDARAMNAGDLKDSGAIRDDSDTIILLHRQRIKTEIKDFGKNKGFIGNLSPYTLLRVDKARYSAGGETYLYFDGARSHYRELTAGEWDAMKQSRGT